MPKPDPTVPRAALTAGISKCLEVAGWRLREARTLLGAAPHTASVLFSFGIEEFGKAALLHEARRSGSGPVLLKGFYSHTAKLAAAGRYLARSGWVLSDAAFDADAFNSDSFDVGKSANADARFASLYVEWDDGWIQGAHEIDRETLARSIDSVANSILKQRTAWLSEDGPRRT